MQKTDIYVVQIIHEDREIPDVEIFLDEVKAISFVVDKFIDEIGLYDGEGLLLRDVLESLLRAAPKDAFAIVENYLYSDVNEYGWSCHLTHHAIWVDVQQQKEAAA